MRSCELIRYSTGSIVDIETLFVHMITLQYPSDDIPQYVSYNQLNSASTS